MMPTSPRVTRFILFAACALILFCYGAMINLKGISTDEGMRLAIVNGGAGYTPGVLSPAPTWSQVLQMNRTCAYQPLYFLLLNSLMRVTGTHDLILFRSVNLVFLALCLLGLLALSRAWALVSRLFLLGLFSFNAYLFMHVLQIREYAAGLAFYIWSTWLALHLDARRLERPWQDTAWFAGYGVLLTLGFYLQTWVVFPAIGQGLFLVLRQPAGRGRFYAHLAISYAIALAATVPYILANHQKVDVGRWGSETAELWPQLSTGFHLVLAGHLPGQTHFTDFLFWFWPAVMVGGAFLYLWNHTSAPAPVVATESRREALLMVLCTGISLAFQIGYFYLREDLSLWPRYFVIHYFFLTWLIALAFRFLDELRRLTSAPWARRSLAVVVAVVMAVLLASGVFQTRSYHRDPYLDTSLNHASNWRVWTRQLSRIIQPGDVVVSHDYVRRATLTFTLPMANRVILLGEMEVSDLPAAERLIYMELISPAERQDLVAHAFALGFTSLQEIPVLDADGRPYVPEWSILVFTR